VVAGFVPLASWLIIHQEVSGNPRLWALVIAALVFSSISVVSIASRFYGSVTKAVCFTILCEGIMVLSANWWLSVAALVLLVAANGLNAGLHLALEDQKPKARRAR
jgi:hypothetical protein